MIDGRIEANLVDNNFEIILQLKLHKLIGRKSPNVLGLATLGIVTSKVLVHERGKHCPTKKL